MPNEEVATLQLSLRRRSAAVRPAPNIATGSNALHRPQWFGVGSSRAPSLGIMRGRTVGCRGGPYHAGFCDPFELARATDLPTAATTHRRRRRFIVTSRSGRAEKNAARSRSSSSPSMWSVDSGADRSVRNSRTLRRDQVMLVDLGQAAAKRPRGAGLALARQAAHAVARRVCGALTPSPTADWYTARLRRARRLVFGGIKARPRLPARRSAPGPVSAGLRGRLRAGV